MVTRPARLLAAVLAVAALATPVRARAQGPDCLVIETFADSQIGQFPLGWKALKDAGKVSYTVQEEAGLRFRAHDPDALAEVAIRVLSDDELGRRLVAEAYEHLRRFDWGDVAEQTAALYADLVGEASPA